MSSNATKTKAGLVENVADIVVEIGDYSSTEQTVKAVSEAGKDMFASMFGFGSVSVQMPKSRVGDFVRFVNQKGLVAF